MGLRQEEMRKVRQTSSGIGHQYTQPPSFFVESSKGMPLPPVLQRLPLLSAVDRFNVTSHSEHDRKPHAGPLAHTRYSRAPPHWNTNYIDELAQKLRNCTSVRLVSRPVSEMQDSFRGQAAQEGPLLDNYGTLLALHGQLDQAPKLRTSYVSTAHEHHRPFSRSEIHPPSSVDAPSAFLGLLKSSAPSRLPPHKAPPRMSCGPRLPRPVVTLPYAGKHSVYRETFTVPAPLPASSGPHPSAFPDWRSTAARGGSGGARRGLLEVPKMYLTESQTYGQRKKVLV